MKAAIPALLLFLLAAPASAQTASSRGDANADGSVNTSDIDYLADYLLGTGQAPVRTCLGDVNADAAVTVLDPLRLIDHLLAGGTAPPAQPAEVCDGTDNDCDGTIDDGFPLNTNTNCGACGVTCSPPNAVASCTTGACTVSSCYGGYANCDAFDLNGCEVVLNGNPACGSSVSLGAISGDTGGSTVTRTGRGEAWYVIRLTENDSSFTLNSLTARITLSVPLGVDYDLYAYSESCGGTVISSTNASGQTETVTVSKSDILGADDAFDVFIEVRFYTESSCSNWGLTVQGNV